MCDAPGLSICCSLGLQRPSGGGGECEGSVVAAERKLKFRVEFLHILLTEADG